MQGWRNGERKGKGAGEIKNDKVCKCDYYYYYYYHYYDPLTMGRPKQEQL